MPDAGWMAGMNLQTKLRSLTRAEARLAGQKTRLIAEARARARLAGQLEGFVRKIGLPPRDLVFALVDCYKVRLAGRRKGRGRRRRTKITPELRDAVKRRVAGGVSMNRTAQEFRLSYAVVMKMVRGAYDQLT